MEIGSIFLIIALLILVGFFIGRPLFEKTAPETGAFARKSQEDNLSALLAERDRVLTALKELDFDHVLGKIPEDEYPIQRAYLLQRGVEILKQIDESIPTMKNQSNGSQINSLLGGQSQPFGAGEPVMNNKLRPGYPGFSAVSTPEDDIEMMIAERRRNRGSKASGFCPKCGSPHQVTDRFCPKCGEKTS